MSRCLISKEIVILSKRKMTTSHKPSVYIFPFSRTRHRVRLCFHLATTPPTPNLKKENVAIWLERHSERGRELRRAVTPFFFFSFAINSQSAKIKAKPKRIIRKIEPLLVYRRTFRITKRLDGLSTDVRQRTGIVLCTPLYTLCTRLNCQYSAL